MKAKLTVIALGALMLMANGANAQHRTSGQTHRFSQAINRFKAKIPSDAFGSVGDPAGPS